MPEQEQPLKEATIKVLKIKEEKWNEKIYWKVIDEKGDEWSLWNKDLHDHIKEGESYPIKYSTKHTDKGDYRTIQGIAGVEIAQKQFGQKQWGKPQRSLEEELQIQRIISGGGIAKSLIESGHAEDGIALFSQWMSVLMGNSPQKPAPKTQEDWAKEDLSFANPPMSTKSKPAVAVQGVPISQLPVEQVIAELWPHLWNKHKVTRSKPKELKDWMANALKDSGFTIPESMEKAKPEQVYAMGEYARREAQSATTK